MMGASVDQLGAMLKAGLLHPDDQPEYYADITRLLSRARSTASTATGDWSGPTARWSG